MLELVERSAVARTRRLAPGALRGHLARMAVSLRLAAVVLLLVFHAGLLWTHIVGGRLFEPAVALRWGIGFLLLGLLVALRRVGVPVLWGRRALVVWVLVALLHVSAALPATATSLTTDDPADVALSLVVLPQAAGVAFAAGLLLLGAMLARAWRLPAPVVRRATTARVPAVETRLARARISPRAPPVFLAC
jgi:hypothetical protein